MILHTEIVETLPDGDQEVHFNIRTTSCDVVLKDRRLQGSTYLEKEEKLFTVQGSFPADHKGAQRVIIELLKLDKQTLGKNQQAFMRYVLPRVRRNIQR